MTTISAALMVTIFATEIFAQSSRSSSSSSTSSTSSRTSTSGSTSGSKTGSSSQSGGLSQPSINTTLGSQSAYFSNTGFVGQENAGTFVGSQPLSNGNSVQSTNRGSALRSLKSSGSSNSIQATPTEGLLYQPRMQVAFEYKPNPLLQVATGITQKVRTHSQFKNVQVEVDTSGELVLTGVVQTADERKLAEAYMRLEPGVTKIVNSIVVEPTSGNLTYNN